MMFFKKRPPIDPLYRNNRWIQIGAIALVAYVIFTDFIDKKWGHDEPQKPEQKIEKIAKTEPEVNSEKTGEGRKARCGDLVTLHYKGFLPGSDAAFEDTSKIGIPVSFFIGGGEVIEAFEKSVIGMKSGGEKRISSLLDDNYKAALENIADITKHEEVFFDINVVSIEPEISYDMLDLSYYDRKIGNGKPANCGDNVTISYREYDNEGNPIGIKEREISFTLGSGEVPAGFDAGITGMKEGGKRIIIIPPDFLETRTEEPVLSIGGNAILHAEVSLDGVE